MKISRSSARWFANFITRYLDWTAVPDGAEAARRQVVNWFLYHAHQADPTEVEAMGMQGDPAAALAVTPADLETAHQVAERELATLVGQFRAEPATTQLRKLNTERGFAVVLLVMKHAATLALRAETKPKKPLTDEDLNAVLRTYVLNSAASWGLVQVLDGWAGQMVFGAPGGKRPATVVKEAAGAGEIEALTWNVPAFFSLDRVK